MFCKALKTSKNGVFWAKNEFFRKKFWSNQKSKTRNEGKVGVAEQDSIVVLSSRAIFRKIAQCYQIPWKRGPAFLGCSLATTWFSAPPQNFKNFWNMLKINAPKQFLCFSQKLTYLNREFSLTFCWRTDWLAQKKTRKRKETADVKEKKAILAWDFEVVKEIYEPHGLAPETRCGIKLKILLKTPS